MDKKQIEQVTIWRTRNGELSLLLNGGMFTARMSHLGTCVQIGFYINGHELPQTTKSLEFYSDALEYI